MEPLYSAGCKQVSATALDPVYLNCLTVTKSASRSGFLTSTILILCALLYRYIITPSLLSKLYGSSYTHLQPSQQKKFLLHHVGLVMKLLSLIFMLFPTFWVFIRGHYWTDPFYHTSQITLGDVAFLSITMVSSLFIFQLLCEEETKLVHILHHICATLATQGLPIWGASTPVDQLSLFPSYTKVAELCLLWVLFSGVYSVLTTSNNILRRCLASSGGALLHRLYFFTFYSTSVITMSEALAILYPICLGSSRSDLSLKITVILLQILFTGTKVLTTLPFYTMGREQKMQYQEHQRKARLSATCPSKRESQ
ncbi:hypothetical protein BDV26DRAFT_281133 [Aspergillus bertholletiae]|uniref:TLC domain-containing protein n=1 Tax=Aspergillus bertholletiae TaxID=1226010 RepID=A0A5N7B9B5_9EURO|nr:hypothetical protein BDV26DRAFT_281133 [Aspergillus bertholletiae]